MKFVRGVVALALSLASGLGAGLAAESIEEALGNREAFAGTGRIVIRTVGSDVVVALDDGGDGLVDRLFMVATSGNDNVTSETKLARVAFWQGRLLIIDSARRKALLFAAPDVKSAAPRGFGRPGQFLNVENLKESLRSDYEVSHVEDVQWIASRWGRLNGLRLDEIQDASELRLGDHLRAVGATFTQVSEKLSAQNPTKPDDGSGGCGVSCTQSCGDGSQCSIACNPPRCATCSCVSGASCTCR